MALQAHNIFFSPKKGAVTQRMAESLKKAFALNPNLSDSICDDQRTDNLNDALSNWLNSILLSPDHQLGTLLMPYVTQRFDEYLNQLMR